MIAYTYTVTCTYFLSSSSRRRRKTNTSRGKGLLLLLPSLVGGGRFRCLVCCTDGASEERVHKQNHQTQTIKLLGFCPLIYILFTFFLAASLASVVLVVTVASGICVSRQLSLPVKWGCHRIISRSLVGCMLRLTDSSGAPSLSEVGHTCTK